MTFSDLFNADSAAEGACIQHVKHTVSAASKSFSLLLYWLSDVNVEKLL